MTKNPIKLIRNPNSPEAIQARLDGYTDPTPYDQVKLITDPDEKFIFIDLTTIQVDQEVAYTIHGGSNFFNKRLTRRSYHKDDQGRAIVTSYYQDYLNLQTVVIKSFHPEPTQSATNAYPDAVPNLPVPRPSFGFTVGGFYSGARGYSWRNEGRSVDELRKAQQRLSNQVEIQEGLDLDADRPLDHFDDDFTGQR